MPRKLREQSPTGIYHVMLRGINKQQIFFDDEDNRYFIELLAKYKESSGYKLYAFCLMGNHVHILIHTEQESLDTIMRRIECSFVYWYNAKYDRVGHLFQDRYRSEPVTDERYLLNVLRYILQNPVKAKFCASPDDYEYSSGKEYLRSEPGITDTSFAEQIMSAKHLKEFLRRDGDDQCLEYNESQQKRLTDAKAAELIKSEFGTMHPKVEKPKYRNDLNESIRKLIKKGISIRQLSRLTGLPKSVIESAKNR